MRDRTEADDIVQGAYNRALLDLIIPGMRRAAKNAGYAITVHGSLNRDIDLVAIPWVERDVASPDDLLTSLIGAVRAAVGTAGCHDEKWTQKPHGRLAKIILAYCGQNTAHIDLSVMPSMGEQ